ncbi:MAG: ech hydrogenase subunit [Thermoproteota archaeon]|nr:ech hydrogenase subunit [Thermoproteota archaeon]
MSGSKYIEIPIGPQHPALHEPILFRVKVEGEKIVDVIPSTGYNHRGIERLCEDNTFLRDVFLAGRVCGICNVIHTTCYSECIERVGNIDVPPRAKYLRTILNELERIHSHMLLFAILGELIGFQTLFMLVMRDRESILTLKELIAGNRIQADYVMPGGVRKDLTPEKIQQIKKALDQVRARIKYYKKVFENDSIIKKRLSGVGILDVQDVYRYGFVGPIARASGVKSDVRCEDYYAAYNDIPFNVITRNECDSWSRMMVRVDELFESVNIVEYAVDHLPEGPIGPKAMIRTVKAGEAIARVEAPRGELVYYIISKGGDKPYRVKIRTPSFNNILNCQVMFKDANLADLPAILVSLDPCISCMERLVVVEENGRAEMKSLVDLAR